MSSTTYTCPMHPEVTSDKPGRCPKCGMNLVEAGKVSEQTADSSSSNYQPLVVIISLITIAAGITAAHGGFAVSEFLLNLMTGFFLVFGGFKLMDLKGFVEGYATYDLLASRVPAYGYVYPFIELGFGIVMLAGYHPDWLLWTEFAVMAFSGLGVALKLARRERFQCACLGTFLKVPLTYVTLVEDFGMAIIALVLIFLV